MLRALLIKIKHTLAIGQHVPEVAFVQCVSMHVCVPTPVVIKNYVHVK